LRKIQQKPLNVIAEIEISSTLEVERFEEDISQMIFLRKIKGNNEKK